MITELELLEMFGLTHSNNNGSHCLWNAFHEP